MTLIETEGKKASEILSKIGILKVKIVYNGKFYRDKIIPRNLYEVVLNKYLREIQILKDELSLYEGHY